jgi:hypothetical protein
VTGVPFFLGDIPELKQIMAINQQRASEASAAPAPTSAAPEANVVPLWVILEPVVPGVDRAQAEEFARLLFGGITGFVNLRAIEEPAPEGRKSAVQQRWLPINGDLPAALGDYVEGCAEKGFAAYLLPHPVSEGGGGLKDILAQRVVPIDIDQGDIGAKMLSITGTLGEPWLRVQSGGVENGQPKAHLYYRLAQLAQIRGLVVGKSMR